MFHFRPLCIGIAFGLAGAVTRLHAQDELEDVTGVDETAAQERSLLNVHWEIEELEPGTTVTSVMGDACSQVASEASEGDCVLPGDFDLKTSKFVFNLSKPIDARAKVRAITHTKPKYFKFRVNLDCNACDNHCKMFSNLPAFDWGTTDFIMPRCSDSTDYE